MVAQTFKIFSQYAQTYFLNPPAVFIKITWCEYFMFFEFILRRTNKYIKKLNFWHKLQHPVIIEINWLRNHFFHDKKRIPVYITKICFLRIYGIEYFIQALLCVKNRYKRIHALVMRPYFASAMKSGTPECKVFCISARWGVYKNLCDWILHMGSKNLKNTPNSFSIEDYKAVASQLNTAYPNIEDVMLLRQKALLEMIAKLPHIKNCRKTPDNYALDDIRFEWFFLKKGSGEEKRSSLDLKSKF
jgi:hypothetical protein